MKINFLPAFPSWSRARRSLARAVMLAGLGSISLSLTSAGPVVPPERVPSRPAEASAPVALAASVPPPAGSNLPCMRVAGQDDGCGSALQMVFKAVDLAPGRQGQSYALRSIVSGGTLPYRLSVTEGQLPAGLKVSDDGQLSGVPSAKSKSYFTLQVTDSSVPPLSVRQRYALRVDGPKATGPGPAPVPASAPTPTASKPLTSMTSDDAKVLTGQSTPPQIASYVLRAALKPPAPAVPAPAGSAPEADTTAQPPSSSAPSPAPKMALPIVGDPEQLSDMLAPLVGVEYPTEALFKAALDARHCAYYVSLVTAAAKKRGDLANTMCPPEKAKSQATAPASEVSLPALYEQLLPDETKKVLVANAAESHLLSDAKQVLWNGDGCGCITIDKSQQSYMIYPFWQADGKVSESIRFSNINRIGMLGIQLNDAGSYDRPHASPDKGADAEAFIGTAQRFGTKVDLVLHRSHWATLLDLPHQDEILNRAAHEAVVLADTKKTDMFTAVKRALLPGWGEPTYLYDGITVFFDNAPTQPASLEQFNKFYKNFIDKLIAEMQKTGRSYQLSIVIPDQLIGDSGTYGFDKLMGYIESAERPDPLDPKIGAERIRYRGTTDIHVRFLVTLTEPTQESKRKLRGTIDNTNLIEGLRRIKLLQSIIPVIFSSGVDVDIDKSDAKAKQLEMDLTYFSWQFGGVAFWPLPAVIMPGGNINASLGEIYSNPEARNASTLFDAICPNRSVLRLMFMGLLAFGSVAFILYFASCRVRDLGRAYVALLSILSVLIFVVGLMLLYFDPRLESLKEGNWPLVIFGSVVLVGALWRALQTREKPP